MSALSSLQPQRVFKYFEEICSIPHGSKNMEHISKYCMDFANKHSLKAICDSALNVIIYKPASAGYENLQPVILQGHLDMVCQKEQGREIDFEKDGLELFVKDGLVGARGTTLGADNGIAVAVMLAILEDNTLFHPPIEAVFTTDEEIGMTGASELDTSLLKGRRMINLDSEEIDCITVSCAGGSDFSARIPFSRLQMSGCEIELTLKGLKGGHSGMEINSGRVNADILMGRVLDRMNKNFDFSMISVDGGDKRNAIPAYSTARLCCADADNFKTEAEKYLNEIKSEISFREPNFDYIITAGETKTCSVIEEGIKDKIIYALLCVPNGITQMSAEIDGLVETSLNLGILKSYDDCIVFRFALRSNKNSALLFLEEKLKTFFTFVPCETSVSGHHLPWEFNSDSALRSLYEETYKRHIGASPRVEAIHAGLECGIFADKIKGLDVISVGPQLYDVHTVNERLDVDSTEKIYRILLDVLAKCK